MEHSDIQAVPGMTAVTFEIPDADIARMQPDAVSFLTNAVMGALNGDEKPQVSSQAQAPLQLEPQTIIVQNDIAAPAQSKQRHSKAKGSASAIVCALLGAAAMHYWEQPQHAVAVQEAAATARTAALAENQPNIRAEGLEAGKAEGRNESAASADARAKAEYERGAADKTREMSDVMARNIAEKDRQIAEIVSRANVNTQRILSEANGKIAILNARVQRQGAVIGCYGRQIGKGSELKAGWGAVQWKSALRTCG